MDLAQAEAVADLIASTSAGAHRLAIQQLRGGVSNELRDLREQLLHFTSLIELELDFGEEDVEFADRKQLRQLVDAILNRIDGLVASFSLGNALKQGLPTVILGKPNAGKSTLLTALLQDDRAIVSNIAGTTRDVIEDRVVIDGVEFRLQDTAGVRETQDVIEAEGVARAVALAQKADLVIYLFDLQEESPEQAAAYDFLAEFVQRHPHPPRRQQARPQQRPEQIWRARALPHRRKPQRRASSHFRQARPEYRPATRSHD